MSNLPESRREKACFHIGAIAMASTLLDTLLRPPFPEPVVETVRLHLGEAIASLGEAIRVLRKTEGGTDEEA